MCTRQCGLIKSGSIKVISTYVQTAMGSSSTHTSYYLTESIGVRTSLDQSLLFSHHLMMFPMVHRRYRTVHGYENRQRKWIKKNGFYTVIYPTKKHYKRAT